MKSRFEKIVFYVNIVVDVIVIGFVIYYLGSLLINKIKENNIESGNVSFESYIERYNSLNSIKCSALDNNDILYINYGEIVFTNGDVYTYLSDKDKLYSNGEQCKKMDVDFKIKGYSNNYLIGENNKMYFIDYEDNNTIMKLQENAFVGRIEKLLIENSDILYYMNVSISDNDKYNSNDYSKYYVIKKDGNLYQQYYNNNSLIEDSMLLNSEDYGSIKYINASYDGKIKALVTSNGLYTYKIINEECRIYQDIKCNEELVMNDVYKEYSDKIKYIGERFGLTKDNILFSNEIFYERNYN